MLIISSTTNFTSFEPKLSKDVFPPKIFVATSLAYFITIILLTIPLAPLKPAFTTIDFMSKSLSTVFVLVSAMSKAIDFPALYRQLPKTEPGPRVFKTTFATNSTQAAPVF